jgi:hypothetical protein
MLTQHADYCIAVQLCVLGVAYLCIRQGLLHVKSDSSESTNNNADMLIHRGRRDLTTGDSSAGVFWCCRSVLPLLYALLLLFAYDETECTNER